MGKDAQSFNTSTHPRNEGIDMNVYVVLRNESYEGSDIVEVYEDKADADRKAKQCNDACTETHVNYSVEEYEVKPAVEEHESDGLAGEMVSALVRSDGNAVGRKVFNSEMILVRRVNCLSIIVKFGNGMSLEQRVSMDAKPSKYLELFASCYEKAKVGH